MPRGRVAIKAQWPFEGARGWHNWAMHGLIQDKDTATTQAGAIAGRG